MAMELPVESAAEETPVPPAAAEPEEPRRRRKAFLLFLLLFLLALLVIIALWYFLFRQPITPPIPLIPDSRLPGYSTAIYGADNPMGVAVTTDGDRIYVADTEGDRVVRVFDAAGNQLAIARPPETEGTEHVPLYVAIDPKTGEVYVSDRVTGAIYVYDREGVFLRTLALAEPILGWQPIGLAFDGAGNLYVADLGGVYPRVLVIDRSANVVRTMGEVNKMSFANGLAVDSNGYVYVADSNNGRLMVFGTDGQVVAQVGRGVGDGKLGLPRGVAVDGNNRVYVVDATGQGVAVFRTVSDPAAGRLEYIGFIGGEGAADGKFAFPNGVAADGHGRIYVADSVNDRIQIWSY